MQSDYCRSQIIILEDLQKMKDVWLTVQPVFSITTLFNIIPFRQVGEHALKLSCVYFLLYLFPESSVWQKFRSV